MVVALPDLPKYLVLEPLSTVRLEVQLEAPACEIDVALDNPRPGLSFVLLVGHRDGPFVQRVRLAGRARIYFDPEAPGEYVLLLANPQKQPVVVRLRARDVGAPAVGVRGSSTPHRPPGQRAARKPGAPSRRAGRSTAMNRRGPR